MTTILVEQVEETGLEQVWLQVAEGTESMRGTNAPPEGDQLGLGLVL